MRERMAAHRINPACASCHNILDPIGLSMENFDAIGRWRTRTEAGSVVDSSGGLPGGSTFDDQRYSAGASYAFKLWRLQGAGHYAYFTDAAGFTTNSL